MKIQFTKDQLNEYITRYDLEHNKESITGILYGDLEPLDYTPNLSQYYNKPTGTHALMLALNALTECFGVESCHTEESMRSMDFEGFEYLNAGDTYDDTLVLYNDDLFLTTKGDMVKRLEDEGMKFY